MPARLVLLSALLSGESNAMEPADAAAPSMELLEFLGTFRDAEGEFVDPLLFREEDPEADPTAPRPTGPGDENENETGEGQAS